MALYRNISISFWTDTKIDDDFTPEDKYFYLYLLTNPHTNICGCYEISLKQMSRETGYNEDTVKRLIKRMEQIHNVIRYDDSTKEIFLINWSKYNWSSSDKVRKAVESVSLHIKSKKFKPLINDLINNNINTKYISDNRTETETDTESESETDTVSDTDVSIGYAYPIDTVSEKKPQRHKHGEYKHVLLTDEQYSKLIADYGKDRTELYIRKVDEYCQQTGKTYKDYNLTIRNFMRRDGITAKNDLDVLNEGRTDDLKILKVKDLGNGSYIRYYADGFAREFDRYGLMQDEFKYDKAEVEK